MEKKEPECPECHIRNRRRQKERRLALARLSEGGLIALATHLSLLKIPSRAFFGGPESSGPLARSQPAHRLLFSLRRCTYRSVKVS